MKRILIIAVVIIAAILAGAMFINIYEADTEVTRETTKVGVILNGAGDDLSWGQSHAQAVAHTANELNLEALYRENVTPDSFGATVDELVAQGCEIIIINSVSFADVVIPSAEKYPDVYFFHASGVSQARNLMTFFGRMYQIRFLCGVVAGMQTKTNEIGYVAAFPYSEVNRGINAFALGARAVNPDATVYVEWTGSWVDDEAARNATERLISNRSIDVMTLHTDSIKPLDVAQEHGVMSIGYNIDNSERYPDTYLTAAVWEWENFYTPYILRCLQGKFEGEIYWLGIDTGVVSLSPFTENVDDSVADMVQYYSDKLSSGEFDVFYGPVKDNTGRLRVADGENMTDLTLLNAFDWYVEGVVTADEQ